MRLLLILLLLLLQPARAAVPEPRLVGSGPWSEPVGDLRGRILVYQGVPLHDRQPPETAVYLELQHASPTVGNAIDLYFDNRMTWELKDGKSHPVPLSPQFGSGGRPGPAWLSLPYDSTVRLRVNPYGFGLPKSAGFMLPLGDQSWTIPPGTLQDYFFSATFTSAPPDGNGHARPWKGTLTLPAVRLHFGAQARGGESSRAPHGE